MPATPISSSGVTLSDQQWSSVLVQFEESVSSLAQWLQKCQTDQRKVQSEIHALEEKVAALRKENRENSNVFSEIRLKGLLNDLKEKLEKNSELQHQWDDKQKEFEQKALSLTALYNDRIEMELGSTDSASSAAKLDAQLSDLTTLVQKRNQVQTLLKDYGKRSESEQPLPVTSLGSLKSQDREGLQLTMDLLRDRKKDLEEELEKWSLEQEETKNELKLQGKMQEFLDDIHQINEDSSFSRGGSKSSDLEGIVGKNQKTKLENHLSELQNKIAKGQKTLGQINQFMAKVQTEIDALSKGGEEK